MNANFESVNKYMRVLEKKTKVMHACVDLCMPR